MMKSLLRAGLPALLLGGSFLFAQPAQAGGPALPSTITAINFANCTFEYEVVWVFECLDLYCYYRPQPRWNIVCH